MSWSDSEIRIDSPGTSRLTGPRALSQPSFGHPGWLYSHMHPSTAQESCLSLGSCPLERHWGPRYVVSAHPFLTSLSGLLYDLSVHPGPRVRTQEMALVKYQTHSDRATRRANRQRHRFEWIQWRRAPGKANTACSRQQYTVDRMGFLRADSRYMYVEGSDCWGRVRLANPDDHDTQRILPDFSDGESV